MRLTSIEFENFRCFEKEKIELHPQLNVFVGLNASGKTALLEGIGLGLASFFLGMEDENVDCYYIQSRDQRQELVNGSLNKYKPIIRCKGHLIEATNIIWRRDFGDAEPSIERDGPDRSSSSNESDFDLQKIVKQMVSSHKGGAKVNFPVILYFSTQRIWGAVVENGIANKGTIFSGYFNALNRKPNSSLFERELEQMQLVVSQGKEFGFSYDSSRLDLIRSIAAKVIEDCKIFYYDYEKQSLAVIFNDGRRLTINELSDGQKSLLLISTGIAFQCATLNPHMGLDAYKSAGVVLIDEVELHLHPDWQRKILPILTTEFPNIQFICTTHSPQVISTLKPENVQVIKDFKVTPISGNTKGRDSNSILNEVFGLSDRPQEYALKLNRFYDALDKRDEAAASQLFEDLQKDLGMHDHEIVKAEWRLMDLKSELDSHAVH